MIFSNFNNPKLLALVGNSSNALSSFVFSFLFLYIFSREDYAVFSFSLVYIAFASTLVNSVFIYPYISSNSIRLRYDSKSIFALFCIALPFFFCLTFISFGFFYGEAVKLLLISIFICSSLLRYYLRVVYLQYGEFKKVYYNDFIHLALCLFFIFLAFYFSSVYYSYLFLIILNVITSLLLIKDFEFNFRISRSIKYFSLNFNKYGKNSVISSLGAEIMVTSVSFVIIYSYGAAAYAPVAIAMLFFRPFTIVLTSLNQNFKFKLSTVGLNSNSLSRYRRNYLLLNYATLFFSFLILLIASNLTDEFLDLTELNNFFIAFSLFVLMSIRIHKSWETILSQAYKLFTNLKRAYIAPSIMCFVLMTLYGYVKLDVHYIFVLLSFFEIVILVLLIRFRG